MRLKPFVVVALVLSLPLAARCDDPKPKEGDVLQGTWLIAAAELAGKPLDEQSRQSTKLVVKGDRYTETVGKRVSQATVKRNPVAKPKALDITITDGPSKGSTVLAIYERDGDTLKICYDLGGKVRPTEFKTREGTQLYLVTYTAEIPKAVAAWEYPGATIDWKSSGNGLFNAAMTTTDDLKKVYDHYEVKTCNVHREVASPDGKHKLRISGGAGLGGLLGSYAVMTASANKELAEKLGLKADFGRVHFGARDDSVLPSDKGEERQRSVTVRVTFQDTEEYNVHIVVSRAADEKHTHVVVTYVRK